MRKQSAAIFSFTILLVLCLTTPVSAQAPPPHFVWLPHNQGNLQTVMVNSGAWGADSELGFPDPFTGEVINGTVYPRNSGIRYGSGSIFVGAKVGSKTLVTGIFEFFPDIAPFSEFQLKSIDRGKSIFSEDAFSELDMSAVFYDTLITDFIDSFDKRRHIPIGIRLKQRSMAWSGPNLDVFILITY